VKVLEKHVRYIIQMSGLEDEKKDEKRIQKE
jgi:hypothetical protein